MSSQFKHVRDQRIFQNPTEHFASQKLLKRLLLLKLTYNTFIFSRESSKKAAFWTQQRYTILYILIRSNIAAFLALFYWSRDLLAKYYISSVYYKVQIFYFSMQTVVLVDFLSDEDECVSDPCQRDGKCHVDGTSYKCECTGAWEGTTCSSKCYYGESLHGVLLLRAKKTDVPPPPPGFRYLPGSKFEKKMAGMQAIMQPGSPANTDTYFRLTQ